MVIKNDWYFYIFDNVFILLLMNILDTHKYSLRLKLNSYHREKHGDKWNKIKEKYENGDNEHLCKRIKNKCQLESNKLLPYMNERLGGNNNKQIRFDFDFRKIGDDIIIDVLNANDEKWTYDELDDILRASIKVLNEKIRCECVCGCIEMCNKKMSNKKYFDSDSDTD